MANWRLAKSLEQLRTQLNAEEPGAVATGSTPLPPVCSIGGCLRRPSGKGWCKPHYDAFLRTGDPNTYRGDQSHLTLWQKVQEIGWTRTESGCLEYNGSRNENNYGQYREGHFGGLTRVHRLVYSNLVGELGDDEKVLHKCDNPPCGEPSHLRKGSQADNLQDMYAKGRDAKANWVACPNGHPYPADRPRNVSKNRCQECARERNRRYHAKKEQPVWAGL